MADTNVFTWSYFLQCKRCPWWRASVIISLLPSTHPHTRVFVSLLQFFPSHHNSPTHPSLRLVFLSFLFLIRPPLLIFCLRLSFLLTRPLFLGAVMTGFETRGGVMVTLIMMMVVMAKWRLWLWLGGGVSALTHLACPDIRVEASSRQRLSVSRIFFRLVTLDQHSETGGRHNVLQATLGPVWALDKPSLCTSTSGGHESAFISRTKRLIYFSRGIKGHCKNALCSLSNIKRVRQHKGIPVVTGSEDHYQTGGKKSGPV